MATQKITWVGSIVIALVGFGGLAFAQSVERFSFAEPHLGTIVEITLYAPNESVANDAARSAFARIKELDLIFSDYKPESETMRLCAGAGTGRATKVSSELFHVIKMAEAVSEQSEGAFDITVGPLVQLWRKARKEKRLPPVEAIREAKQLVNWKLLVLNEADQTVELTKTGMRLDFGGIAKGYIGQEVSRRLRENGCSQTLVAVAGDIVAGQRPPSADGWKVGVAPLSKEPRSNSRLLRAENCAISTSGDAFQFVEIDGNRYSHIVDPRTGFGLTRRSSVTIIANDGAYADAMATAVCVLGSETGLRILEKSGQAEALIVESTSDGVKTTESKGFCRHVVE